MIMYPYLRLMATLLKSHRQPRLELDSECVIECRAGITDIDVFGELNNARQLAFFELARWAFSQRVGFMPLMRKNKWGFVVGGASVRYRRRVPFLSCFRVTSRILCHDGRWFYFLQEIYRNDDICTSSLIKAGVTGKEGLVPATDVARAMGQAGWNPEMPDWVQAWVSAEGQRPWPKSQ